MNEDFDTFEQEINTHVYSRIVKIVAVIGFFLGIGLVFMAN